MRLLLAIFLPPVVFLTIGRPIAGLICLLLMITLIGWIPTGCRSALEAEPIRKGVGHHPPAVTYQAGQRHATVVGRLNGQ